MGMVAFPFLLMMFGIINTGMFFYAVNCIDRGLEDAARFVRTGEAQKGTVSGFTGQMTAGNFKSLICQRATGYIDCSKLQVRIQAAADWSGVVATTCATSGDLTAGAIASNDATPISNVTGTQSSVVLITACYQWQAGKYLPFVKFDKQFSDGSTLIQSSVALKIEPYI